MKIHAKLVAVIATQPGAGRSVCAASIAMNLAKRWRCTAVDLDTTSGSLRNLLGTSRVTNLDYLPLSRSGDDTETLLRVLRSSSEHYAIVRLPDDTTGNAMELFAAADIPIVVTEAGPSALESVRTFFKQLDAKQFKGRRVYMIVNRLQRGGEEKAALALVKKIQNDHSIDLHILGTVLYDHQLEANLRANIPLPIGNVNDPTAIAFDDIAVKIERNAVSTPRMRKATPKVKTKARSAVAPKRKKEIVQVGPAAPRKLSEAMKRIEHLESTVQAQAFELKQLQERVTTLTTPAKRPLNRRYVVSFMGASLALGAVFVTPPFIKSFGTPRPVIAQPIVAAPVQVPLPPSDGAVLQQVLPNVPQSASDTIQGRVRVTVKAIVDTSGNVADAVVKVPGPSKYFAGLAIDATRNWKFTPPRVDNKSIASEWMLEFTFENDGPHVLAVQAQPPRA